MKSSSAIERVAVLALSALATGVVSGVVVLGYRMARLPPTDLAYGQPVWVMLQDPFVLMVFIPITVGVAFIGFLASLLTLVEVDLSKAVPLVSAVTVGVITVTTHWRVPHGAQLALGAAVLAMLWCRFGSGWLLPPSSAGPSSQARAQGLADPRERKS